METKIQESDAEVHFRDIPSEFLLIHVICLKPLQKVLTVWRPS